MDEIRSLTDRPKLYGNVDGTAEISMGLMFLGFSTLQWLQAHSGPNALWHQKYVVFPFLVLMIATIHYGNKAIKERITYPRTGYVEYRRWDKLWLPMTFGVVTGALTAVGMVLAIHWHWVTGPAFLAGLLVVGTYSYYVARTDPWKWIVTTLLALAAFAAALLPSHLLGVFAGSTSSRRLAWDHCIGALLLSCLLYGVIFLISGGVSLWLYLRHTQPPVTEPQ